MGAANLLKEGFAVVGAKVVGLEVVGDKLGPVEGFVEGASDCIVVGLLDDVGLTDGTSDGVVDGGLDDVGLNEGTSDGIVVGESESDDDVGLDDGVVEGGPVVVASSSGSKP